MNVRKVAETAKTVTLAHDVPAGAVAFELTVDGSNVLPDGKRHFYYDGSQPRRIGKVLDGRPHSYGVRALGVADQAAVVVPDQQPVGHPVPVYEITLAPYWWSHTDDAENVDADPSRDLIGVWLYPTSPSTPYKSPDDQKHVQRYLLLDPRYTDALGNPGCDEWWFIVERYWPGQGWDPMRHGRWGRLVNFHNVAGDAGPQGGVGWGFGAGTSALALDWLAKPHPEIDLEPAASGGLHIDLPVPDRDMWHTYLLHYVAGRTDGSTVRPGALTVWADGVKVFDRGDLNTVQRAQGPDGQWYVQRWMQLWEGDYTGGPFDVRQTHRAALTRIGRTLDEAKADTPRVAAGFDAASFYYNGRGADTGPPKVARLPDRDGSLARLPSDG